LVEQVKEMDRRLRVIASQSQACEILMSMRITAMRAQTVDETMDRSRSFANRR
jgi:hypothetical protein